MAVVEGMAKCLLLPSLKNMKQYKHLFFDLDRTLWDFDRNSRESLKDIIDHFSLQTVVPDVEGFVDKYHKYNDRVWNYFKNRTITKSKLRQERFRLLMLDYGVSNPQLIEGISDYYIDTTPDRPHLIEGAMELLEYLKPNYQMSIISNGFYEVQERKLKGAKIDSFFSRIITSDRVKTAKPDMKIFQVALSSCNAKKKESLMIGDDAVNDVFGAKMFGMDQAYFNKEEHRLKFEPSYWVSHLLELKEIL